MSKFGWCVDGFHADNPMNPCPGEYKKFWFEKRKRKEVLVYADEPTVCECPCHKGEPVPTEPVEEEKPKRKPRRKK